MPSTISAGTSRPTSYDHGPLPECVGLLVSGGHTHLLHVRSLAEPITELGTTVDDAAGEAYDKVARLLGLGYPGRQGDRRPRPHRRPRRHRVPPRDDRSSGRPVCLQLLWSEDRGGALCRGESRRARADVAAGFQEAVADVLTRKAVRAATDLGVATLLIAGGVAANSRLRELAESVVRSWFDTSGAEAPAVYRQRRDDRLVRRPPGRRRAQRPRRWTLQVTRACRW